MTQADRDAPCVCGVDDQLVREWVYKAREVARAKGWTVGWPANHDSEPNPIPRDAGIAPDHRGEVIALLTEAVQIVGVYTREGVLDWRARAEALIARLKAEPQPNDGPEGERLLLNAYGRKCFDAGFAAAKSKGVADA